MSQGIWGTINPNVTSGTNLATLLNAFKDAFVSGFSGTSRPPNLQPGGYWVDTTNAAAPNYAYSFKIYTGTADIEFFRVNINGNFGGGALANSEFDITHISADTTAAILGLYKQRVLVNGQVNDGDVIGEIQFVGRTNTSTDPVVANFKWTSSDVETDSVFGGYLSLYCTPENSGTITEHIRFIGGLVETIVPQKLNSLRLVGQNVATTATIVQLSASKVLVEFTGSTATDIQGIKSTDNTQEITLHNRSSAAVTLRHQNVSASANDRIKLPNSTDYILIPDACMVLFYDATDLRWKIKSSAHSILGKYSKEFRYFLNDWTCPATVTEVLVTPYRRRQYMSPTHSTCIDVWGNPYTWGQSVRGGLGDGTQVDKSSPVALAGGISFTKFADGNPRLYNFNWDTSFGIDNRGILYAWGVNTNGQLGVGDVAARSSPVAVLGGKKWAHVYDNGLFAAGTATDGISYAWGATLGMIAGTTSSSPVAVLGGVSFEMFDATLPNSNGGAMCGLGSDGSAYYWGGSGNASYAKGGGGDGTVAAGRAISPPTAVMGGFTFKKIGIGNASLFVWGMGLTKDGALYSWGTNSVGQLGLGDLVSRSSPVAVLAGTTFIDFAIPAYVGTSSVPLTWAMALAEDGTLYAWGANGDGQLGLGDVVTRSSPVAVLGGIKFKEIQVGSGSGTPGGGSVLAIAHDGTMYGWGLNTSGQLGLGDLITRSSPVAVMSGTKWSHFPTKGWKVLATMLAVTTDGLLYSWGGGLADSGTGSMSGSSSPVAVLGGINFETRVMESPIAIPVTPGQTYRISMPNGRAASFGNVCIGNNIERCSIEYDIRGD